MPEVGGVSAPKGQVAAGRALACMRASPWAGGRVNGVRPGAWAATVAMPQGCELEEGMLEAVDMWHYKAEIN